MPETDYILDYMKAHRIPMTRPNYLSIAFLGDDVPDDLDAEFESTLPARFRRQPRRPKK